EKAPYFFDPPAEYDPAAVKKRWTGETPTQLENLIEAFSKLEKPRAADFEGALRTVAGSMGVPDGDLIHAVRLAVSGVGGGPGVFQILEILGKDESLKRIRSAVEKINTPAA
ncbi:MAG TPA: glutamate--tRNA ligase, partial [Bacteroidota bacterium]|nr:glutamate--tRNA ligase [Bacteroidota bacterium]